MAGFRTFATGEVLTAANVNDFLMKQSVMVFADATARTAALGAEVTEGMLTFNKDTGALEVFDGSAFVPAGAEPPAGIGSNVVQTVKTDVFTANVAQGAQTAITGLSATITPTTNTSRILVLVSITHASTALGNSAGQWFTLNRGGTDIFIGDADGTRTRVSSGSAGSGTVQLDDSMRNTQIMFLDSPATTSATTYGIDGGHNAASTQPIGVNRSRTDSNVSNYTRGASTITLIEVAV